MSHVAEHFTKRIIEGFVFLLPLGIVVWIIKYLFESIDDFVRPPLAAFTGYDVTGMGVGFALIIFYITGMIIATKPGKQFLDLIHKAFSYIPVVKNIYSVIKTIVESFTKNGTEKTGFKKVVAAEYPRKGIFSLGVPVASVHIDGRPHVAVYFPTVPMPQSGTLALFPVKEVRETSLKPEELMKFVFSLGLKFPQKIQFIGQENAEDAEPAEHLEQAAPQKKKKK